MDIKEFFYFQKSDRQVLLVLLCVIVAATGIFMWVGEGQKETAVGLEDSLMNEKHTLGKAERQSDYAYYYTDGERAEGENAELFPFDPNTADSVQLARLGLPAWQIRNIYRYRQKGGIYRQPQDFARLYGLTVKQYRRLEPYIRISADYGPASSLYEPGRVRMAETGENRYERDTLRYPVKLKVGEQIALNQADTMMLKKVPGIGSVYARAILNYGKRLGGYYQVAQLKEIDGFPEEAVAYFKIGTPNVQKLNVNKLTVSQLRRHPYFGFYRAKAIVDYRRLHGNLKSLKELALLKEFSPEIIRKLEPYVEF
ncbi:MAG: helix-hairpin-helix domain-containing protein [Prevotellaceae bacterium]|nr:helix-hairpin-helix domain-containing protein [Prevotella sp.]MDD7256947.1 helix-hairpin-helix domain-containing protein [Prevotellaceae bacterium]MDY6131386.1 helix-hairpin-helix domain-containing protein [Prevotella sp.]